MAKKRQSPGIALAFMSEESKEKARAAMADTVAHIPLEEISPDPGQPRRLLPPDLAASFLKDKLPPLLILDQLIKRAQEDAQLAKSIDNLADIANDIATNGLINPITVCEVENGTTKYIIETGERRWWAHWWLVKEKKKEYKEIRALIVPPRANRVRQLSENLKRQELTAVETSIGLATLILEIQGDHDASNWYQHGQLVPPLLRQLANSQLKHGVWPQIEEKLGRTARHWRNYLNLLRLTDDALHLAHHHNLKERFLREVLRLPDEEQTEAIKKHLTPVQPNESQTPPPNNTQIAEETQASEPQKKPPITNETQETRRPRPNIHLGQIRDLQAQLTWHTETELNTLQNIFSDQAKRKALLSLQKQIESLLMQL